MSRKPFLPLMALAALVPLAAAAAPASLTAAQIVEKNVAARGGLEAWRAVHTLLFSGKMDAGGKTNPQLPFRMELKRPRKSRVEIDFAEDTAIQVYDGTEGWKLRPFLNRKQIEPFTADQLKAASMESELDGFLVDYAAKGTTVKLDGVDKVDGRDAYKLALTLKDGQVRHVWIDAETYLEAKIEGVPRRMDGKMRPVEVFYRDFRPVDGLMIPYVLETAVAVGRHEQTNKIAIDQVVVNPVMEDSRFTKLGLGVTPAPEPHAVAGARPGGGTGTAKPVAATRMP
jgi:outer membrane lipoprotein-sorting protein